MARGTRQSGTPKPFEMREGEEALRQGQPDDEEALFWPEISIWRASRYGECGSGLDWIGPGGKPIKEREKKKRKGGNKEKERERDRQDSSTRRPIPDPISKYLTQRAPQ